MESLRLMFTALKIPRDYYFLKEDHTMKFVIENAKQVREMRANSPKKAYKAMDKYIAKAETIRRNEIRQEKRRCW